MNDYHGKDQPVRVGLLLDGFSSWRGGREYAEGLIRLLQASDYGSPERIQIWLLARESRKRMSVDELGSANPFNELMPPSDAKTGLRRGIDLFLGLAWLAFQCRVLALDSLFPAPSRLWWLYGRRRCRHWIPDFQHEHLPAYFSDREIQRRRSIQKRVMSSSPGVVVSSLNAKGDLVSLFPMSSTPIFVLPPRFPTSGAKDDVSIPHSMSTLPTRGFFYCGSQWWKHKGIKTILDALDVAIEKQENLRIVMSRPGTESTEQKDLLRRVRLYEAAGSVVTHEHLVKDVQQEIMRRAIAVIQASEFEGWNLQVDEAQQQGVPVILTDIPVHREQSEGACLDWFRPGDAQGLAEILVKRWRNGYTVEPGKAKVDFSGLRSRWIVVLSPSAIDSCP